MPILRRLAVGFSLSAICVVLCGGDAFGQGYILNGVTYAAVKTDGTVEKIGSGFMDMLVGEKLVTVSLSQAEITKVFGMVKLDRELKFRLDIEGTADSDYLAPKQLVSFSADLDASHKTRSDVQAVSVILPSENSKPGLTASGAVDAKTGGSYLIVGEVMGQRNGNMTVKSVTEQGKPVTINAKLAAGALVSVHVADLGLVKKGDVVHLSGFQMPGPPAGGKTAVMGEVVNIVLSKPVGKAKPAGAVARKPDAKDNKVAAADAMPDAKPDMKPDAKAPAAPAANANPQPAGQIAGFDPAPGVAAVAPTAPPPAADPPAAPNSPPAGSGTPARRTGARILVHDYFTIDKDQKFDFDSRPAK